MDEWQNPRDRSWWREGMFNRQTVGNLAQWKYGLAGRGTNRNKDWLEDEFGG